MTDTTTAAKPLPPKLRLASNITEGMEILDQVTKEWCEVTHKMHVTAPVAFVRFEFSDDGEATVPPKAKLMSRRGGSDV